MGIPVNIPVLILSVEDFVPHEVWIIIDLNNLCLAVLEETIIQIILILVGI